MRLFLALVVGYLVTFLLVFGLFTAAWYALGAERSFEPGSFEVSPLWIGVSTALGFLAAVGGGCTARAIGRTVGAVRGLAILLFVLGALMTIPALLPGAGESEVRDPGLSMMDAMNKARTPPLAAILNPIVGAAGVLVGGRRKGDGKPPEAAPL